MVFIVTQKPRQFFLSLILLGGAAIVSGALFLNRPSSAISEPVYVPITVDVAQAVKQTIRIPVVAQGTVSALQSTNIQAEVKGRVVELSPALNVGGFIAANEVMLRIDPRDYQTNLLRALAAVESAESSLAQERGRAQVAKREWEKLPQGSQRSQDAKDLYLRKPQLEQAEAQLLAARADHNTAKDNLDRTVIRSPYDAIIREKQTDLGQFVAAGSPLAAVFSVEYAEVRLPIPQSKLAYLDLPGLNGYEQGVSIDLHTNVAGDINHWQARLDRTEGVFDERSRALFTVARIEDPYGLKHPERGALRIGTFVNATIQGKAIEGLVRLPRYILRAGNNLWVVDTNNRLRNRQVTVLRTGGDQIYVSQGLQENDLVSLTTVDTSLDGAEVSIISRTPSNKLQGLKGQ
ncbi:MAG: RND family efflux transporter MFP subunit [Halieaceae bacterium]